MTKEDNDFIITTQKFADLVDYILRDLPENEGLEARTMAVRTCIAGTLAITTLSGKMHNKYMKTMKQSYLRAKKALRVLFYNHPDLEVYELPEQIEWLDEKINV